MSLNTSKHWTANDIRSAIATELYYQRKTLPQLQQIIKARNTTLAAEVSGLPDNFNGDKIQDALKGETGRHDGVFANNHPHLLEDIWDKTWVIPDNDEGKSAKTRHNWELYQQGQPTVSPQHVQQGGQTMYSPQPHHPAVPQQQRMAQPSLYPQPQQKQQMQTLFNDWTLGQNETPPTQGIPSSRNISHSTQMPPIQGYSNNSYTAPSGCLSTNIDPFAATSLYAMNQKTSAACYGVRASASGTNGSSNLFLYPSEFPPRPPAPASMASSEWNTQDSSNGQRRDTLPTTRMSRQNLRRQDPPESPSSKSNCNIGQSSPSRTTKKKRSRDDDESVTASEASSSIPRAMIDTSTSKKKRSCGGDESSAALKPSSHTPSAQQSRVDSNNIKPPLFGSTYISPMDDLQAYISGTALSGLSGVTRAEAQRLVRSGFSHRNKNFDDGVFDPEAPKFSKYQLVSGNSPNCSAGGSCLDDLNTMAERMARGILKPSNKEVLAFGTKLREFLDYGHAEEGRQVSRRASLAKLAHLMAMEELAIAEEKLKMSMERVCELKKSTADTSSRCESMMGMVTMHERRGNQARTVSEGFGNIHTSHWQETIECSVTQYFTPDELGQSTKLAFGLANEDSGKEHWKCLRGAADMSLSNDTMSLNTNVDEEANQYGHPPIRSLNYKSQPSPIDSVADKEQSDSKLDAPANGGDDGTGDASMGGVVSYSIGSTPLIPKVLSNMSRNPSLVRDLLTEAGVVVTDNLVKRILQNPEHIFAFADTDSP